MLTSFEVRNFRAFSHLVIPRLGSVNLIVGKNNVGKTVLLEALRLYASGAAAEVLHDLLSERDCFDFQARREDRRTLDLDDLFHNSPELAESLRMEFGPSEQSMRMAVLFQSSDRPLPREELDKLGPELQERAARADRRGPGLAVVQMNYYAFRSIETIIRPERQFLFSRQKPLSPFECTFVPATGVKPQLLASWWDSVTLRDEEEQILGCLRLVADIERLTFVQSGESRSGRVAMIRLQGAVDPVPLRQLGDGVTRLFQMALAIHQARRGAILEGRHESGNGNKMKRPALLVVDEIENGIHFSVLPNLWRFLFRMSALLNVQIVATTHSWDCIKGFRAAAESELETDCLLVRLEKRTQGHRAVLFERGELAAITEEPAVEVR